MADHSPIEWTDATWNPITGCSKVSPGCAHCYAETLALTRLRGRKGYPGLPWTPENAAANVVLRPERLDQPLRWRRPRRIFVNSLSDLFHELVPDDFLDRVFLVMGLAQQHTFQVLTKRPERMRAYLTNPATVGRLTLLMAEAGARAGMRLQTQWAEDGLPGIRFPNVWLGTSIENDRFTGRAGFLRETPAAVRFLSCEPLLGPLPSLDLTGIGWVIVGGESGPGARPMHSDWARDLRDRARAAGAAYLFKQWGVYARGSEFRPDAMVLGADGRLVAPESVDYTLPRPEYVRRTSKHLAGRELDGRTWDEYPAVPA